MGIDTKYFLGECYDEAAATNGQFKFPGPEPREIGSLVREDNPLVVLRPL